MCRGTFRFNEIYLSLVLRGAIFLRSPSNENLEAARTCTGHASRSSRNVWKLFRNFRSYYLLVGRNHVPSLD